MTDLTPIEAIFFAALEKTSAAERSAYLDHACEGDFEARQQVERMLAAHPQLGGFLNQAATADFTTEDAAPSLLVGSVIAGRFKLIRQVGEGGMGIVFEAEQLQPVHRKVAIKLVRAGLHSRSILQRFDSERQALAVMDHPNIAKVHDAGMTGDSADSNHGDGNGHADAFKQPSRTGRPFFVMELVDGVPITEYCDTHRLKLRQRLELFVPVCQAIQHAHQKGIIHRDIKPSNVLVATYDGRPVPKVIDFGVAKAIGQNVAEDTTATGVGAVIGTLEYMSPEQAEPNQRDIDTRSDVYSLGVLLYELLTGSTPLDRKRLHEAAWLEMLRVLREVDPPKPSTRLSTTEGLATIAANRGLEPKVLSGMVRGELDWIAMKSLEKDRTRRYATANGLAHDIERYLHDEPVQACPPSPAYRLRKFVRRNRGAVVAVSLLFLTLLGGIIGTSIGLVRSAQSQKVAQTERQVADRQRERAERHYQRALAAVDRLLTRVGASNLAPVPHMDETRRQLLEDALEFYQGFLADESDDAFVRREIGRAYGRIGRIQEELGRIDRAEEANQRAVEVLRVLVAEHPGDADRRFDLFQTQRNLARVWHLTGRSVEAERMLRDLMSRVPSDSHRARDIVSKCQYLLGIICYGTGRPGEAEREIKALLEVADILVRDEPSNLDHELSRASALNMLGLICRESQRLPEAEKHFLRSKELHEGIVAKKRTQPDYQCRLSSVLNNLGLICAAQDRAPEAERFYRQSIDAVRQIAQNHPDLPDYQNSLASAHNNLGLLFARTGDQKRAIEENMTALKIHEELMQRYPQRAEYALYFAMACGNQAKYLLAQQLPGDSIPWNTKAIDTLTADFGATPSDAGARLTLFTSLFGRAGAFRTLNEPTKAVDDFRRAIALSDGERHPNYVQFRPRALAYVGDHARAAAEAEAIVVKSTATGANCKEMANVLCTCVNAARQDPAIADVARDMLVEQYASRAVAYLTKAGDKKQFQKLDQVSALRTDERLKPIQDRADFKTLLDRLEAAVK